MKKFLAIIGATLVLTVAGLFGHSARAAFDPLAQPCIQSGGKSSICDESKKAQNASGDNSLYGPSGIITKIVSLLNIIIGAVAVVMVVIGGFKYVISNGDANNVNSARNTIIYALVGIVIAVSGQLLVVFVLNKL